jgi:anti-sigma regulatory factor (Ser/Thr protein kinase)
VSIWPTEILRLRLRCDSSAPRLARKAVERLEAISPVREEALLVTSELASNAVIHSGSTAGDEIELRAELLGDCVRIEVRDAGRSQNRPALREMNGSGPGGYGLRILDALGRRWGSDRQRGQRVWVDLAL